MYLDEISFYCPFCGEQNHTDFDRSNLNSSYIEDCQVCCRPIKITVHESDDSLTVFADRD